MQLAFEREISASEWIRNASLPRSDNVITAYLFPLAKQKVGFLMFLAPPRTFFAEFGLYRPFRIAHAEWLASDEYQDAEEEMKRVFAPLAPSRTKWPQVGEPAIDRFDIAVPLAKLSEVLTFFQSMASQLDGAVAKGRPWSGTQLSSCPDPRWIVALTEWSEAASKNRHERMVLCTDILTELRVLNEPKSALPLQLCRALSVSLALAPFPPRGQYVPRAEDFDDLNVARAEVVKELAAPCLYNAIHAAVGIQVDEGTQPGPDVKRLIGLWRNHLTSYCQRMADRYAFLAWRHRDLFFG